MKKDIHPQYYPEAKVTCACGNTFTIGSTQPALAIEMCSNCHPFYTGQDKVMDKVGRIQKFKARLAQKSEKPKKALRLPLDKLGVARGKQTQSEQKGSARVTTKPIRQAQGKKA